MDINVGVIDIDSYRISSAYCMNKLLIDLDVDSVLRIMRKCRRSYSWRNLKETVEGILLLVIE